MSRARSSCSGVGDQQYSTRDQAEALVSAVVKGDSDRGGVIEQGLKAKVQELLPGHRHRDGAPHGRRPE